MSFFKGAELKAKRKEIAEADKRLDAAMEEHEMAQSNRVKIHDELATIVNSVASDTDESTKCKLDYLARISSDCLPVVKEEVLDGDEVETKLDLRMGMA